MPTTEQPVKETLKSVISESVRTEANPAASQTPEGTSTGSAGETSSGETHREFVRGIDISDIPEQDRPRIKEKLEAKLKLADQGIQKEFQKVAEFKKAQDDLEKLGLSVQEAHDVLLRHAEQKKNPAQTTAQKKEVIKTLDKLIESAPSDQQAALSQMRQIILEETDISSIRSELAEIKQFVLGARQEQFSSREKQLRSELDGLREKFGDDLVNKHAEDVVKHGLQYKDANARRLFNAIVDPDELDNAILNQKAKTTGKPVTQEKLKAISSPGSGVSGTIEDVDVRKVSLKDLIRMGVAKK